MQVRQCPSIISPSCDVEKKANILEEVGFSPEERGERKGRREGGLIPRLSGRRENGLVLTACACTPIVKQNLGISVHL